LIIFFLGIVSLFFWGGLRSLPAQDTVQKRVSFFRERALNEGVSTDLLDEVLTEVRVNQEVLRNRRNQPEFTMDYSRYREIFINSEMIENGRKKLERHDKLLNDLTDRYGVPSEVLVAIWGVESRYGTHENEFDVLNSLYTLAFASPEESRYFKGELLATLKGLDQEIIP